MGSAAPLAIRRKMLSCFSKDGVEGCRVWGGEGAVSNGQELLLVTPETEEGSGVHGTLF